MIALPASLKSLTCEGRDERTVVPEPGLRRRGRFGERGLRFEEETARSIGKAEARAARWGRVALWLIALTLVWIAWKVA